MDTNKLLDILLNDFITDNYKSILINGRWGCGKTYLISKFIDKEQELYKEIPCYYLSAFGFKTIEELHTKVYSIIHPSSKLIKLGQILNSATPLIPYAGNAIKEALDRTLDAGNDYKNNINNIYTKRNKSNNNLKILIIDDFERTKIDYENLLGYFNQLYLYNIKIICVGDLNNINNSSIDKDISNILKIFKYKEKIFDREYRLNDSNEDIIRNFFKDTDKSIIDEDILKIYESNLRLVKRASSLYKDINNHLNDLKFKSPIITNKTLAYYSSLITRVDIDDTFASIEQNKNQVNPFKKLGLHNKYDDYFSDKQESNKLLRIGYYDYNNPSLGSTDNKYKFNLIIALAKYYFNNSFDELDIFINNLSNKDKVINIYEKLPLLLSNKDKKILFKDIYEDLKTKTSLSKNEFYTILSCNKYNCNFGKVRVEVLYG